MRLLLLITSLRRDDVYVENDIEMKCWWFWKCIEMMHVVYVFGGWIDLVGCPWWGKIEWLKSLNISKGMFMIFNSSMVCCTWWCSRSYVVCCVCSWGVHWPCRMFLVGENIVVKEFKHIWGDGLGSLTHPWSLYLMVLTFICCMLCMFMGGACMHHSEQYWLHLRVEVRCMHHSKQYWLDPWMEDE